MTAIRKYLWEVRTGCREILDNRVEVITPVYDSRIKEDLWKVIDFGLRGNCQGSVVDGSGKNCLWTTDTEESFRSQEELYKYYKSHITND